MNDCNNLVESDQQQVVRYIYGLNKQIKDQLHLQNPNVLAKAASLVETLEEQLYLTLQKQQFFKK